MEHNVIEADQQDDIKDAFERNELTDVEFRFAGLMRRYAVAAQTDPFERYQNYLRDQPNQN